MERFLNKVICGDSLEIMKQLPDKCIDLVLTDPPYGIEYNNEKLNRKSSTKFKDIIGDKQGEIDYKKFIAECQRVSKRTIVFGAINFFNCLPHKGVWICWDKRTKVEADKVFGSPFELAWCDKIGGYDKIYRIMHGGVINADGHNSPRFHPTQKPVFLMNAILKDFTKTGDIVLDPFLGSGTTARACKNLKRNFIGIEISPEYCKIAEQRLKQENLF